MESVFPRGNTSSESMHNWHLLTPLFLLLIFSFWPSHILLSWHRDISGCTGVFAFRVYHLRLEPNHHQAYRSRVAYSVCLLEIHSAGFCVFLGIRELRRINFSVLSGEIFGTLENA